MTAEPIASQIALGASLLAAVVGLYAAWLWWKASKIEMPAYDPPLASISDAPEIHIMDATVRLDEGYRRLAISGELNAKAARWTAVAAALTAIAVVLGAL